MTAVDAVVIGGGIAGVSVAYELVARGMRTVLVEQESQLAHHTTGRSAAVFLESYGPPEVRALSRASRPLYAQAPERLGTELLLTPRESLWLAPPEQLEHLGTMLDELPGLQAISVAEALAVCPVLRPEAFVAAALEADAAAIDVLGLHQGYVRRARALGLVVDPSWPVSAITPRSGGGFTVAAAGGTVLETGAVVIAAGAWSDQLAVLAGARPVGLEPKRRTIAVCRTAAELSPAGPLVGDCDHGYYWKPEGPNVLCSPADETPSDPCDARPEELDVALALERVNATTRLQLRSVVTAWAGLRTFAPDRVPVAGADPHVAGLWWSAGQGGYGIQTAPAQAALLAALIAGDPMPDGCRAAGVTIASLSPARFAT